MRLADWEPEYVIQHPVVECKACKAAIASWDAEVDVITGNIFCGDDYESSP